MSNKSQLKHSLRDYLKNAIDEHLSILDGTPPSDIYHLVLAQVEAPLLEIMMQYAEGNQSRAAVWLGLSRTTLGKLLKKYDIALN